MTTIINPKCSRCHNYFIQDEVKSSGLPFKTCKDCRENSRKRNSKYLQSDTYLKRIENDSDKIKEKYKKYRQENQEKIKEIKKKYRQENQGKIKEYKKQYKLENKEKIKEYNKEYKKQYSQKNKEKIKENKKNYYHNIKNYNIPLYLCIVQRKQLARVIKLSNQSKTKHSIEYLGCDCEYFKNFLQSKIDLYNQIETNEIKMDFSNIHIDHIKPISKFNLDNEEEFLDCCNYTNLQPLLIKDNLEKSNKWTDENDIYWSENIKGNNDYKEIYLP